MKTTNVRPTFIWDFKTGDNINFNLGILRYLYQIYTERTEPDKYLLHKPMLLTIISVIESVLHDFHKRIHEATREGVEELPEEIINYIRGKKQGNFETYIASAKKNNLFNVDDLEQFYNNLDTLRIIRNRIHIQNTRQYSPEDEFDLYLNDDNKKLAEYMLELILKLLQEEYPRFRSKKCYVETFSLPWVSQVDIQVDIIE